MLLIPMTWLQQANNSRMTENEKRIFGNNYRTLHVCSCVIEFINWNSCGYEIKCEAFFLKKNQ